MAKIVNLTTFRKQKARAGKRSAGDANAAKHGQSKAEKSLAKARLDKADKALEGHRKEPDTE
ncbi:DUF4169 family protein [Sagittula salina]|uniref:DUF4169 family protein n=1 Tax=Sagittula salina TaxID=2820268 RepID=A0A940MQB3_9RHOB|nr:DUF4169 family protein [Sagittula salina]MBP0482821.1 DUF4169 family protein [Sagittula salina]